MSKKDKQVNVTLSGDDLELFETIQQTLQKRFWRGPDAEVLRICLRFYGQYYKIIDILEEINIDPLAPIDSIKKELENLYKEDG